MDKLAAVSEAPRPLSCQAIPTKLVLKNPACADQLLWAMNGRIESPPNPSVGLLASRLMRKPRQYRVARQISQAITSEVRARLDVGRCPSDAPPGAAFGQYLGSQVPHWTRFKYRRIHN